MTALTEPQRPFAGHSNPKVRSMSPVPSFRLPRAAAVLALMVAAASTASAQESRIVVAGSGAGTIMRSGSLPISDDAVSAIVAEHFADAIRPGAGAQHISIVVDANNQYVSGRATKATIISRDDLLPGDGARIILGDTARIQIRRVGDGPPLILGDTAHVMIRRIGDGLEGGVVSVGGVGGSVTIMRSGDGGPIAGIVGGAMTHGLFGADTPLENIAAMGMKRFTAGMLGDDQILVTVVKLK